MQGARGGRKEEWSVEPFSGGQTVLIISQDTSAGDTVVIV